MPGIDFPVEFHFYSADHKSADALISGLGNRGMLVTKRTKRTLIIFKGWEVTVTISRPWTLEQLDQQCVQFATLAEQLSIDFERCGAYIRPAGVTA
ncbi:hypothetical protein IGB42_01825 [Andreprevotia sp. IGB-42]|uniref:ribonuclease E inhibitor RraB n=1 Tax=Andreprevotia sp. IGB-42 TaxID=2497473 RepID=UPI00135843AF|nr:ribonuclease E inhibitor RraB [Andreprevotia sp. IGB-42]KAF0813474.1 hypothetical protein IGB42_01825 [Andreprevotia sp. IGB-42]